MQAALAAGLRHAGRCQVASDGFEPVWFCMEGSEKVLPTHHQPTIDHESLKVHIFAIFHTILLLFLCYLPLFSSLF